LRKFIHLKELWGCLDAKPANKRLTRKSLQTKGLQRIVAGRDRGEVACLEFYPFQYEEAGELICKFFELCLKVVRVGGPPAEGLLFGSFVVNA
jgi:hypothetical protein